jgi:hypothetical protein
MQHPTPRPGWRGLFATRLWPWVALAGAIPPLLDLLLVDFLGQQWLAWILRPAWAVGPVATWLVRGRGREPMLGFYALVWLWLLVIGWTQPSAITVQGFGLLLIGTYWGLWSWFCKLRKLPSTLLALADKLSVCIFVVTGPPGLAASIAGPDAAKQWDWLAVASLVTSLLTLGVVVLGAKGPALLQELAETAPAWALSWLRAYSEPSVLVAVALGYITVMLTFQPLAPDWLDPWLGLVYISAVLLLTGLLLRRSQGALPAADRTPTDDTASTPPTSTRRVARREP